MRPAVGSSLSGQALVKLTFKIMSLQTRSATGHDDTRGQDSVLYCLLTVKVRQYP